MQAQEEEVPIPLEELYSSNTDYVAITKTMGIIQSTSGIISFLSSSILIWILKRSNARFTSIYHRMLLGMSVGDLLFSLSYVTFNSAAPSDIDYWVWNARGNQATCSAQGFALVLGMCISVFYLCSLNLYSLAVVKYNKTDRYVRAKIEPLLHGVPIGLGFIFATIILFNRNLNNNGGGICYSPEYDPPHCIGYSDGEIRDGFEIPCGRGHDGATLLYYLSFFIAFFVVPVIIGVSLWMIYRAVKQQEHNNARYGAGAFTANAINPQTSSGASIDDDERINHHSWLDRLRSSVRSTVSHIKNRRSSGQSSATSNSRVVLRRAFAFTISYFLTWSFPIIGTCFDIANKDWPNAIWYLGNIVQPLQGFFNLCIFLQPTVLKIKSRRDNDVTWYQAVMEAIWSSGNGSKAQDRGVNRVARPATREHQPQMVQPVEGETKDAQLK